MRDNASAEPQPPVVGMRDDILDHPMDLPPRDRLGTIANMQEETSRSRTCATITVINLDVSKVVQMRSAVALSS